MIINNEYMEGEYCLNCYHRLNTKEQDELWNRHCQVCQELIAADERGERE